MKLALLGFGRFGQLTAKQLVKILISSSLTQTQC